MRHTTDRPTREYARRLGDRLKDRIVLTIFPHLAQGFLVDRKQRLGQAREPTEAELADVFAATLTLLYRLLFLLYAESRDLLPIREAPHHAASLKKITEEIAARAGVVESDVCEHLNKGYSAGDTPLYDRLCRLFRAMDKGDPILNVPIYLLEHKVPDRYLALAIDWLARDQDERTLALVFIDYQSLEVRLLGSIYEGLLALKLKVAEKDLTTQAASRKRKRPEVIVRKNEVYLSNDKLERKASGSYYTPEPIVAYIVANTVGPVLDEKLEALRPEFRKVQWAGRQTDNAHKDLVDRLFDLRVLDPAMGSGHFLVETVDFVTDRLLEFLDQFPINPVTFALEQTRTSILESLGAQGVTVDPAKLTDINLLKRHVLERCIYGVDLDPMAVELAKVSLWLDAFALGAPLTFLDHHLRCGNALIGATVKDLEDATARRFALEDEPLRAIKIVFDCLVAQHFGLPEAADLVKHGNHLDLTDQKSFYASLRDDRERTLVAQVEALAQRPDRRFFHWEIEFPEVFFGLVEGTAGFDCVVGNPPWGQKEIDQEEALKRYTWKRYPSTRGIFDYFRPFIEQGTRLLRRSGAIGLVLPDIILLKDYVETRRHLLETLTLRAIDWWGMAFADATIDSATIIAAARPLPEQHRVQVQVRDPDAPLTQCIPQVEFLANPRLAFNLFLTPEKRAALRELQAYPTLGDYFEVHEGVHSGNIREELFVDTRLDESCRELYFGRDEIAPYRLRWNGRYLRLAAVPTTRSRQRYANVGQPDWHEREKVLVRRTGDHVLAAVDSEGRYASNNFFLVLPSKPCPLDVYGLAALLNSRFMTWFFRTIEPRRGRVFAELKIKHLSIFPLPRASAELNRLGRRRTEMAREAAGASGEAQAMYQDATGKLDVQVEENVRRLFAFADPSILEEAAVRAGGSRAQLQ